MREDRYDLRRVGAAAGVLLIGLVPAAPGSSDATTVLSSIVPANTATIGHPVLRDDLRPDADDPQDEPTRPDEAAGLPDEVDDPGATEDQDVADPEAGAPEAVDPDAGADDLPDGAEDGSDPDGGAGSADGGDAPGTEGDTGPDLGPDTDDGLPTRAPVVVLTPAAGTAPDGRTATGAVTFTGTAAVGSTVAYTVDDGAVGSFDVPAEADVTTPGRTTWSHDVEIPDVPGLHVVRFWYQEDPTDVVEHGVVVVGLPPADAPEHDGPDPLEPVEGADPVRDLGPADQGTGVTTGRTEDDPVEPV